MSNIADKIRPELEMYAGEIVKKMKENLQNNENVDTGKLLNSCHYEMEQEDKKVTAYIYADAKSDTGTSYAEFIEFGTGVHNENGDGRTTPWRQKDKSGNFHVTTGYEAHPFIRPAVEATLPEMREELKNIVSKTIQTYYKGGKKII